MISLLLDHVTSLRQNIPQDSMRFYEFPSAELTHFHKVSTGETPSILGLKIFLASLMQQSISSSVSFTLSIIEAEVASQELLGLAKSTRKIVRALEFFVSN